MILFVPIKLNNHNVYIYGNVLKILLYQLIKIINYAIFLSISTKLLKKISLKLSKSNPSINISKNAKISVIPM
jgi:hypothetical protein